MANVKAENGNNFENHIQTGLQTILILIVGWVGMTTSQSAIDIAGITAKVERLQTDMSALQSRSILDYKRPEAEKDQQLLQNQLNELKRRLDRLEK